MAVQSRCHSSISALGPNMHIEAIYDQGRLEFQRPVTLKHQRLRVRVEIPDQEIIDAQAPTLPTYELADFPAEIRDKVQRMTAIAEQARREALPASATADADSEEAQQRWAAVELRNASRAEQGRMP